MTLTLMRMALAGALAVAPLAATAQQVVTAGQELHLRAGPDMDYPLVAILGPGIQVIVQGCLADYRWCDVSYGPTRGWVHGMGLQVPLHDRWEPLPTAAAVVGVGVLAFVLHDYWRDHYRDRHWYRDRDRWVRPPPHPHPPPPRPWPHGQRPPAYEPPPHRHAVPVPAHPPGYSPPRLAAPDPHGRAQQPPPRRDRVQPAPAQPRPEPAPPAARPLRNDPNSGWDSRYPDAPRPDRP